MANKTKTEQAKVEEIFETVCNKPIISITESDDKNQTTKEIIKPKIQENYQIGTNKWTNISSVFIDGVLKTTSVCNLPTGCMVSVDLSNVSTSTVYIPNVKYNEKTSEFVMNV